MNNHWIKAPIDFGDSVLAFVKKIGITKSIKEAILTVSSIGIFAFFINGERVGDEVFTPGWTKYTKRVQKIEYDVTEMIEQENELKVLVGTGWAVGRLLDRGERKHFADHVSVVFKLKVTYIDDSCESFYSDEDCDVYTSNVTFSSIYDGETIDATAEIAQYVMKLKQRLLSV